LSETIERTLSGIECAVDFVKRPFPPVQWMIPNLLPEGLTMLAAKPKIGKSFLALNIAQAIACGGKALSKIDVEQGRVLYINVDSSEREFQKRVRNMLLGEPP